MKRPLHALTFLGTFAHHSFELSRGVGLVFQPELGLIGASALWAFVFPGAILVSTRGSPRWNRVLAFSVGANLAAALLHFSLWPSEIRRGIPTLIEAEGLSHDDLPTYNTILHLWSLAGLAAIVLEVPPHLRRTSLAGFAITFPFRTHARYHFNWVADQARQNPAWWNRALQEPSE